MDFLENYKNIRISTESREPKVYPHISVYFYQETKLQSKYFLLNYCGIFIF